MINVIRRHIVPNMLVIGICIFAGSAMALDLGGVLNQAQKIMQQQDQQHQQEQQRQEAQQRQQDQQRQQEQQRQEAQQRQQDQQRQQEQQRQEAQQRQQDQQRQQEQQRQEAQQRQQDQQRQQEQQRQEAQQRQQEQQRQEAQQHQQEQEGFFASDPMACSAGFSQLPKSVEKLKSIKVAGFSAGPLACIEQQLLAKCEVRSYPAKGAFYYDAEARCSTESGSLDLMLFATPSGPVISRMHLVVDLQVQAAKKIFRDEPLFKNLVNKYGPPINIGAATEPYDVLVWSEGGYDHKAWKAALNNRSVAINILLKLNFSSAFYEKQKTEIDRLKSQQVAVPKL